MAKMAHPASVRAVPGTLDIDRRPPIPKNNHKVVLESVTQEKKKLRSVISFKAEPPKGYTFIPAGNPELTNALKDFARKGNYEIYAVSTTPHHRAHDLSQQVHRIGFHFPSVVVAQVCAHYGVVLSSAGTVLGEDEQTFHRRSKRIKEKNAAEERKDQVTINTEARDTIKDLFPNIPDNDLNQIIKTAFQKGQGKVGTAIELTLIRRAQLAVVAHTRHIYTDYDKLLRQTHYRDARNIVEKPTLRKLVEWRGDDESGKQGLEDVFREVIVISDDEESSDVEDDMMNDVRDVSVEIVSSNTKAAHLGPDPFDLEEPLPDQRQDRFISNIDKRLTDDQYVEAPVRKQRAQDRNASDRRGFSRYRAWNEARDEYRANLTDLPAHSDMAAGSLVQGASFLPPSSDLTMQERPPEFVHEVCEPQNLQREPRHLAHAPEIYRAEDGSLYERRSRNHPASLRQPGIEPLKYGPRVSDTAGKGAQLQLAQTTHRQSGGQYFEAKKSDVLPSIEHPRMAATSSEHRMRSNLPSFVPSTNDHRGAADKGLVQDHLDGIEFLDLTEDMQYMKKRRKFEDPASIMPTVDHAGNLPPNHFWQHREPQLISLVSPTGPHARPSHSSGGPALRHTQLRESERVSYASPVGRDEQGPGSARASRAHDGSFTRPPVRQVSTSSHLPTRRTFHEGSSTRIQSEIGPLHQLRSSKLVGGAPVDRGVQKYRAFRAREKQDRGFYSPSERSRHPAYQVGNAVEAGSRSLDSKPERFIQTDGAWSSRDLVHLSPSQRPRYAAEGASYILPGGKGDVSDTYPAGQSLRRRRSASPLGLERTRVESLPLRREAYVQLQDEGFRQTPAAWDGRSSFQESRGPLLLRPVGRHEQAKHSTEYLPGNLDDSRPRSATCRRYYAQL